MADIIPIWKSQYFQVNVCTEHWLQFIKPNDNIYRNSIYTGKWMLFISDLNEHDRQWPILKQAINDGRLGISMKASTSISTKEDGLTCIYTRDFRDIDDVKRILISLRNIGFHQHVAYKADEQTHAKISGSLYWSPPNSTEILVSKAGKLFLAEWDKQE
jgi:hypothetical protein